MVDFWAEDKDYQEAAAAYAEADRRRKQAKAQRKADKEIRAAEKLAERTLLAMQQAEKRAKGKHRKK